MPKLVLHYFDFPFWRAEVCRLSLHLGKVIKLTKKSIFEYLNSTLYKRDWKFQHACSGPNNGYYFHYILVIFRLNLKTKRLRILKNSKSLVFLHLAKLLF